MRINQSVHKKAKLLHDHLINIKQDLEAAEKKADDLYNEVFEKSIEDYFDAASSVDCTITRFLADIEEVIQALASVRPPSEHILQAMQEKGVLPK